MDVVAILEVKNPYTMSFVFQTFAFALVLGLGTKATAHDVIVSRHPKPRDNVVYVRNYAAVLPVPFSRPTSLEKTYNPLDRFSNTTVLDHSFSLLRDASFVVFDEERGSRVLGPSPTLEDMFTVSDAIHEAPVFVLSLNVIIASTLSQNSLSQILINLTTPHPTLETFLPEPPVYGVNGGRYSNGLIYWAVAGSSATLNDTHIDQAPGIYTLDPLTRKTQPLLNNYFGQKFNGPDDLVLDSHGDIFFTDPLYASKENITQDAPVLHQQTYRFRPSTGAVSVVEATVGIPNGIALSPDERTVYISDTSVTNFTGADPNVLPRYTWGATAGKCVFAFDAVDSPAGKYLVNKRAVWYPEEYAVDGLHVAGNGYLVGAAGFGVDVLSEFGEELVRVQTDFVVNNLQFVGRDLWLFGRGRIARVRWGWEGLEGARS